MTPSRSPRRVLTIAGSDSGGGAGIQADLKTFAAHGVHGLSAVTAVTAQNTLEVRAVAAVPPEVVAAQIDAVLEDFGADAVKIGMLWSAETVRIVAARLRAHGAGELPLGRSPAAAAPAGGGGRRRGRIPIVLDPVLAAETGASLLDDAAAQAIAALVEELLPMATLITPNMPELVRLVSALEAPPVDTPTALSEETSLATAAQAVPLTGPVHATTTVAPVAGSPAVASNGPLSPEAAIRETAVGSLAARLALARRLAARGPAVLAKGGHDHASAAGEVVDLLLIGVAAPGAGGAAPGGSAAAGGAATPGERVVRFAGPRLLTRATHGTGCTLSAAIAARLATGEELAAAVGGAIEYVRRAMAAAAPLGAGRGPLAHFHDFQEPYLERS